MTRELQDVKRKYFEQRRKDAAIKEQTREDTFNSNDPLSQQQQQFHQTQPKITGGGFNLQSANSAQFVPQN